VESELREAFESAREEGLKAIAGAEDLAALDEAQVRVFGRKAPMSGARSRLGEIPEDERKELGRLANGVQGELQSAFDVRRDELMARERELRWERERIDVTLPGDAPPVGGLHPLTHTINEIVEVFLGLGYKVADGPEIELGRYLFDALNMPAHHPARSPQDTYFVKGKVGELVVRTETSAVQIRTMETQQPPVYIVVPGRVYRRDEVDPTHLNAFTQIEGLAVDEGITMGDLKGTLETFARTVFGRDLNVRFRPHFFPFTEPSAEMDVQCFVCRGTDRQCRLCKGEGWIEVLGCGMVDPTLFEWVGYDAERYTGFAFGMGVERIAALAHGVRDIRYFWENDLRFLRQFGGVW
jgi:phenylalanyl-tRNA synthetase alpha chain